MFNSFNSMPTINNVQMLNGDSLKLLLLRLVSLSSFATEVNILLFSIVYH